MSEPLNELSARQLKADIERTRAELEQTVRELVTKLDVAQRAREHVDALTPTQRRQIMAAVGAVVVLILARNGRRSRRRARARRGGRDDCAQQHCRDRCAPPGR